MGMIATAALFFSATAAQPQQDPLIIFAVVTKVSKDKKQVTAQVSDGGPSVEAALIPTDPILDNLIWRKLEICHALKAEAWKNQEGYRLVSIRVLDAGMLPMPLQGVAGDCLIKKALDFGPLVD
ncbi:MAG: hypothetical protein FJ245_07805 [Nitrospira sp.]|nr:hypothetical protein [Nitrospira sp.]